MEYSAPDLVRQLQGAEKVVFHCALSQQRGPSAALRYLRERGRIFGPESTAVDSDDAGVGEGKAEDDPGRVKRQEVYVLDGGFAAWQEKYGTDERLTENYNQELWEAQFP